MEKAKRCYYNGPKIPKGYIVGGQASYSFFLFLVKITHLVKKGISPTGSSARKGLRIASSSPIGGITNWPRLQGFMELIVVNPP